LNVQDEPRCLIKPHILFPVELARMGEQADDAP
jgi:hypothetical protein